MNLEKDLNVVQKRLEKAALNERSDSGITLSVSEQEGCSDSDLETLVNLKIFLLCLILV